MNRMHPAMTGAAVAITIAMGYSLCALFFLAFPESSVTSSTPLPRLASQLPDFLPPVCFAVPRKIRSAPPRARAGIAVPRSAARTRRCGEPLDRPKVVPIQ